MLTDTVKAVQLHDVDLMARWIAFSGRATHVDLGWPVSALHLQLLLTSIQSLWPLARANACSAKFFSSLVGDECSI